MIELERHIEILLLNNDCVIVPNLGGFVAHHREAYYDENDQLFLPPLRTIGFNPKLHLNDSLLAQSYIEAYDISYPDAMNRIEEEVNELKQTLENEGCYELNDIGTLSLNEDGHYEFMPCEAGILTPSLYGLSSFDMTCVESTAEETAEIVSMEPETAEEKTMIPAAVKQEEPEEKQPRTITIRVSTLRNAAAIAAAVLALFLITTPLGRDSKAGFSFSDFEKSWLYRIMPKEKTTTTTDAKLQPEKSAKAESTTVAKTNEAQAAAPQVQESQEVAAPAAPQRYWSIVLASKVSMKNAKAYVEQLTNEGYNLAEILVQKSGNRVIYGKYATEKEAYAVLGKMRQQVPFHEAWVYEVKR